MVEARFWFLGEWSMGVFVSNWGRHIAMKARFCEQGLCDDTLIVGSQVLSMGQVMMQVWMGVIV